MSLPKPGSVWLHKNSGNLYKVVLVANALSDRIDEYPVTVVYQRIKDGTVWGRPLYRWHGSMTFVSQERPLESPQAENRVVRYRAIMDCINTAVHACKTTPYGGSANTISTRMISAMKNMLPEDLRA